MKCVEKVIYYDGLRFTLHKSKRYHYNSKLRRHLHQYIWEKAYGKIPKGYEIHHKDLDHTNHDLNNLECLPAEEHRALHSRIDKETGRNREARAKNLAEKARPKASEWHGSPEGIEWHRKQYESMKHLLHSKKEFVCEHCGEKFEAVVTGKNRFCSNKCKSAWRRASGIDDITSICVFCGKEFIKNKYSKAKTCSKACANKIRYVNK